MASFPIVSPRRFRVALIYLRLSSFLSLSPSTMLMMKLRALAFRSFSGKEQSTWPVRCIKILINCLFGSFILTFRVASKSLVVLPNETFPPCSNKAERVSAASFLFCQLPLSFIFGINFKTSLERSLTFPSDFDYAFLLGRALHSDAASPSNLIVGFFCYSVRTFVALN